MDKVEALRRETLEHLAALDVLTTRWGRLCMLAVSVSCLRGLLDYAHRIEPPSIGVSHLQIVAMFAAEQRAHALEYERQQIAHAAAAAEEP